MGHNRNAGRDYGDRVTYAQAAQVLGCHVSNVPRLVARGELVSHGRRGTPGSLLRSDVEQLATRRREARQGATGAAEQRPTPPTYEPDPAVHGQYEWLSVAQAAVLVGLSEMAIRKRVKRGTMPHVRVDDGTRHGRVWIRADHARIAANVRAADPENLTVALADATPTRLRQSSRSG